MLVDGVKSHLWGYTDIANLFSSCINPVVSSMVAYVDAVSARKSSKYAVMKYSPNW